MQRLSIDRSVLLRYCLALVSVAVAIAVRQSLTPVVGHLAAPVAFVTAAVMLSAWLIGTGPAVVAAFVGLVLLHKYFLSPISAVQNNANIIQIFTYLFVSGAAIFLSAAYRRSSSRYAAKLQRSEAVSRELLRERNELREVEEKFRAVAEIASSAILIHDGSRLQYLNKAGEAYFGYSREELLRKDMWEVVHPEAR